VFILIRKFLCNEVI
jgi:hypothetical protein